MDHAGRRSRARAILAEREVDALLVTDPVNVRYLTGFTGSNGQLLLAAVADEDRLITDARYEQRAAAEAGDLPLLLERDPLAAALARQRDRSRRLAAEEHHLTWAQADRLRSLGREQAIEVTRADGLVAQLRTVKDDAEVARLVRACRITTEAMTWLAGEIVTAGISELALVRHLEQRFLELGADGVAFDSIVASGPNGAIPHHQPADRELRVGELLTIDCGAAVDGYRADVTRTIAVGALEHVPARLRRLHELVGEAQAAGRRAVLAGRPASDVDRAARQVIEEAGEGTRFVHGTGHGVGLEVHEAPAVHRKATATLAPGMTLTVEPGIYDPGLGGVRIEDTLVVTADGAARALTDTPRGLV